MPDLDSLKENLNTLRTLLLAVLSIITLLTGGLVSRYDLKGFDGPLIAGLCIDAVLISSIPFIFKAIISITKEVKKL
jgi:hypothetical protein